MRYFLALFFSFVILGSFLMTGEAVAAKDCNDVCTMPPVINNATNPDWKNCAEKCQNEGGVFPPPPSGDGSGDVVSPSTNSGSFKNIGDRLKKVAPGFYGDVAPKSFEETVGGYIKTGLALVGVIFLLLMVYGGYTWMIARGDETEAKKAKDTITMASIGMAVVLIAYVITYFILSYAMESAGL